MRVRASSEFETFVGGLLRGGDASWPNVWQGEPEKIFLALAEEHGVEALIYTRLHDHPDWRNWPSDVREALKTRTQLDAAAEVLRKREIERVLLHLREAGLRPLMFKGTPLAYSHYPAPNLRARRDTDLFILRSEKAALLEVMTDLGCRQQLSIPGDAVLPQCLMIRIDEKGLPHAFDVHWKISNAPAFTDKVTYEELVEQAPPVSQLGPGAYAPNPIYALLIACLHRAAHHENCNRLIWLYDIHLLVSEMTSSELAAFARLAFDKQMAAICLDALQATKRTYDTPLPEGYIEEFRNRVESHTTEATHVYLIGAQSRGQSLWRDLRASDGMSAKLRLLREHTLPPPSYILKRYNSERRSLLPFLYTRRIFEAIPKLFRR
jgi:hypothetical protein